MARFIVVVVVLVAIALLANKYLLGGGDAPPADAKQAAAAKETPRAMPADEKRLPRRRPTRPKKEAPLRSSRPSTPRKRPRPKPSRRPTSKPTSCKKRASSPSEALEDVKVVGEDVSKMLPAETVQLGDPSLTAGIPGEGPITLEEIEEWLADPKNHVVLKPELPLGLKAGEAEIKGLDENPLTRAKIELGRQLYFDPRLSSDASISCASCHDPDTGYAADTRFGVGVEGAGRATATRRSRYNRILSGAAVLGRPGRVARRAGQGPDRQPDRNVEHARGLRRVPQGHARLRAAVRADLRRRPDDRQRRQGDRRVRADARHRPGAVGLLPGARRLRDSSTPPTSKISTRSRKKTPSCTTSTWS